MKLKLVERMAIANVFKEKYQLASKGQRSLILNEFIQITGFNRNYASQLLRAQHPHSTRRQLRLRTPYYDESVLKALKAVWEIMDYICGKRLVGIIPELLRKMEQFNEPTFAPEIKAKLLQISASTIDRLLRPVKRKMGMKGTSMTKSVKYLVDQIPIKTFGEWKDSQPGYTQIDLLAHNGGNVFGGFLYTLCATDVSTSWTTCTLVRDKTKFEMLKSLFLMKKTLPFPLKGIHADNGAEFINYAIIEFARKYNIKFTRGRPYKKNDNPHVEQKNYSVIRRTVGYLRYHEPEHARWLRELYHYLNLYTNYFQPSMILLEKHREGAKTIRKYDEPTTPFQRTMNSQSVPPETKSHIQKVYETLNPAELRRQIDRCQAALIRVAAPIRAPIEKVHIRRRKEVRHTKPAYQREKAFDPFTKRQRMEEMRRAQSLLRPQNFARQDVQEAVV